MGKLSISAEHLPTARGLRGVLLLGVAAFFLFGTIKNVNWLTPQTENSVVPLHAPQISLAEPPALTDAKALRLSYKALDISGISFVALRITPTSPLPGEDLRAFEIALPTIPSTHIAQTDIADLSSAPWAGQKVVLQIVATNDMGQSSVTDPVSFTLPEKHFFHPLARVLIEERKKLLQNPDDENLRDETANIMAGIAHQTPNYNGDPVVMMALRSGAVRLVLNHDRAAVISVNALLWETATRIEDGSVNQAQHAHQDLIRDLSSLQDF